MVNFTKRFRCCYHENQLFDLNYPTNTSIEVMIDLVSFHIERSIHLIDNCQYSGIKDNTKQTFGIFKCFYSGWCWVPCIYTPSNILHKGKHENNIQVCFSIPRRRVEQRSGAIQTFSNRFGFIAGAGAEAGASVVL